MTPRRRAKFRVESWKMKMAMRSNIVRSDYGKISVAKWTRMSAAEKSKIIFQMWQILGAVESLGAAWKVAQLFISWGCVIEWTPNINYYGKVCDGHWCYIDADTSKIALKNGVAHGQTLSESLCAAALRCVELLATR